MKSSLKIHHVKDNCKKFECTNIEKTAIQSFEYEDAIKYFQPMNSLGLYTSQIQVKGDVYLFIFFVFGLTCLISQFFFN